MTEAQTEIYKHLLSNQPSRQRRGGILYEAFWLGKDGLGCRWPESSLAWAAWKAGFRARKRFRGR